MAKRMLADVLWLAAEIVVRDNEYSCIAVKDAWVQMTDELYPTEWWHPCLDLIKELGCNPSDCGSAAVMDRTPDPTVTRSMWLLLAMHVAEDEGLEIEVPA